MHPVSSAESPGVFSWKVKQRIFALLYLRDFDCRIVCLLTLVAVSLQAKAGEEVFKVTSATVGSEHSPAFSSLLPFFLFPLSSGSGYVNLFQGYGQNVFFDLSMTLSLTFDLATLKFNPL